MTIRDEMPKDFQVIGEITADAFKDHPHSNQCEPLLIEALRKAGGLAVSLVAEEGGMVVGHIAFSTASIGKATNWYALGPVAVRPGRQGAGIGQALVRAGLDRLKAMGAKGCVLVGEPGYYRRFGFETDSRLGMAGVPPEYVLALSFGEELPEGEIEHHPAFRQFL
jgi:putative acetyltransferase